MKKGFMTIVILLVLLASTVGTALAGSALELVSVSNTNSGPTFTFRVMGEFSQSELNSGFVQVEGGDSYPLYCAQVDSDTVVCHTSKKVGGHNVVVGFGGMRAWVGVPSQTLCYPVYDFPTPGQPDAWIYQGSYCQDAEPSEGDWIIFYSPYWEDFYDYYYYPGGLELWWENPGSGYYYW